MDILELPEWNLDWVFNFVHFLAQSGKLGSNNFQFLSH